MPELAVEHARSMDIVTYAQPSRPRRHVVGAEARRPLAHDHGLIWLLILLGALGLAFWSAVIAVLVAFL
jgi:hypothetical protein